MEKINKLDLFGTQYEIDVAKDWNESNKDSTAYIKGRTHFNKNIQKFTLTSQNDTARLFSVGASEHLEANVHINALASDGSCEIDQSFNTWISRESQELTLYSYGRYHILLEFSYLGFEQDDDVLVAKIKTNVSDNETSNSANKVRDLFNSLTFIVECVRKQDTVPLNNLYIQSDIVDYSLSCNQPYLCQFPKNATDIKINAAITFTDQDEDPYGSFETIETCINLEYVLHLAGNSWTISGDDPTQYMQLSGFASDGRDTNGLLVYVPTPESSFPWFGSVWGNMTLTFQSLNPGWFDVYMTDISDEAELTDFNKFPIITIPVAVAEEISKEAATLNNQIENLNLETEGLKAALYEETPKTFESSPIKLNNQVATPITLKTFEIKNLELFNVVPSSCATIDSTPTWGRMDWPNSGGYYEEWNGEEAVPPSKYADSEVLLDYQYYSSGSGVCEFLPATASYKNVKLLANTYSYSADLGYLTYNRDDDSIEVQLVITNVDTQEKIYCNYPKGFVTIPTSGSYNITVEGASKEEYQMVQSQTIYLKMCPTASYQSVTNAKNWVIPTKITINSTELNHLALANFARQNSIYKVNYETKRAYDLLNQEYDISAQLTTPVTHEIPVDTTITLTEANLNYNFTVSYKDKTEFALKSELAALDLSVIKQTDYLPATGDASHLYNIPNGIYGATQYFDGGWAATLDLTYLKVKPGTYTLTYDIGSYVPVKNQLTFGDVQLCWLDLDGIEHSSGHGDLNFGNGTTLNIKEITSFRVDYTDGGTGDCEDDYVKGDIKLKLEAVNKPEGSTNYVWLNNKWESLTDKTELASKDYVLDTVAQRTLPLCTKITEHLNIDQYTLEDRDAENIVRIDKLGSSSSYLEPDNDIQITNVSFDSRSAGMNEPEFEQLDQNTIKITASTYRDSNYGSCSVRCDINQISDNRYYDFKIISAPSGTLKNETVYGSVQSCYMATEPEMEYDEETDQWIETGREITYEMSDRVSIPDTVEPELYVNAFIISVREPGEYIIQLYATTAESITPILIKSKPLSILTKDSAGNVLSTVSLSETLLAKCPRLDEGFNSEIYNYIDFINRQYIEVGKYINDTWTTYTQPVVVDLSTEITKDILLKTAIYGTVEIISTTSAKCPVDLTFFKATGAVIDRELSATSTNTIQNAVVTAELTDLKAKINDLASQLDQVEALLDKVINGGV